MGAQMMRMGGDDDRKHSKSPRFFLDRLAWYRARLLSMSTREIVYRSSEWAKQQYSRPLSRGWDSIKPIGPLGSLSGITDRISDCEPDLAALIERESQSIRSGKFRLLGAHWPNPGVMPPSLDFWHIDPDDDKPFPQQDMYCFDIAFRHGVETREVKRIWELGRLQFLVPLAAHAALTNNQDDAELVIALLRSWMEGNPPFRGLNWSSGIELALRIISVALSLSMIGPECLDKKTHEEALRFFFAHVDWIRRFPSLHSSANNHRIAELAGIIMGTTMVPAFPDADDLRKASWRDLLVEIDRQIYPDGVGAEQAPSYTAFAIELFLLASSVYGVKPGLPIGTVNRLSAWAEHSLWLMDTNSRMPMIGDCDDCRAVATIQAPEPRYVASIVSAVAGHIGRPELAPCARDPSIRDVLLRSAGTFSRQRAGLRMFPMGGYSVIRGSGDAPPVLIFDHGPVGYLSIAAHGHADTLAVWLSIGNQPIFVDAGTYLYHSSRALRDAFRGTAIHNTLTLNDMPSSRPSGPFNWATKANAHCVALESGSSTRLIAEHDGYVLLFGLRHRRTVDFDGASQITITDELLGPSDGREVAVSFLLDPLCEARLEGDEGVVISRAGCPLARLITAGPQKVRIAKGDFSSNLGWVSPSFSVRVSANQILLEGTLEQPSIVTINLLR